ncbi:hypothetical protein Tco_0173015 [Tanacetum coccineum]
MTMFSKYESINLVSPISARAASQEHSSYAVEAHMVVSYPSFEVLQLMGIMPPRMRTQSAGWPAAELLGGGTGVRVGRGGRGRRHREGNDERVEDLNGQGND